ncbi:hypothetical protein T10_2274 [Trichinella papuae]|uniref:Uncharacterized protein n=1 Tax=Trichinella papuae TaxID=268474 RepID=A0A0V1M262_9BILA|nr:hypothetical protein T10_2274 [Trichinella papuae]
MLVGQFKLKPCSSTSSGSGFWPLKFRFEMFMVWLNLLEGWHSRMNKRARNRHLGFYQFLRVIIDEHCKNKTVIWQINNGYTRGRRSLRRSAAYGVQQRQVAALTGRLHHSEISIEHFLKAIAYHTPAPKRL